MDDLLIVIGPAVHLEALRDKIVRLPERPWEAVAVLAVEEGSPHVVAILRPWSPRCEIEGVDEAAADELRKAERVRGSDAVRPGGELGIPRAV